MQLSRSAWHTTLGVSLLTATTSLAVVWWTLHGGAAIAQTPTRSFTAQQVSQVEQALQGVDPSLYRINLPVFRAGKVVGTRTYGSLPLAQVRQVAAVQRLTLTEKGNMQMVMDANAAGQSSGASTTNTPTPTTTNPVNGANSHQSTNTKKLVETLDRILTGIDRNQYLLLKPVTTRAQAPLRH